MKAKVGDWLVIKGATVEQPDQRGEITEVRSVDGSPPYVVRWFTTDHESTVYPGPDALVVNTCRAGSGRRAGAVSFGVGATSDRALFQERITVSAVNMEGERS